MFSESIGPRCNKPVQIRVWRASERAVIAISGDGGGGVGGGGGGVGGEAWWQPDGRERPAKTNGSPILNRAVLFSGMR